MGKWFCGRRLASGLEIKTTSIAKISDIRRLTFGAARL